MICEDNVKILLTTRARLREPDFKFVELLLQLHDSKGKDLICHSSGIVAQTVDGHPDDTSDLRVQPVNIHHIRFIPDLHEEERLLGPSVALFPC